MICEHCGNEHSGEYGSGRFCSVSCARSYSSLKNRKVVNKIISQKLTGRKITGEALVNITKANQLRAKSLTIEDKKIISDRFKKIFKSFSEEKKKEIAEKRKHSYYKTKRENINSILDLSKRTVVKIFERMGLGCSLCGWDLSVCDIHHINGRKIDNPNSHYNLTYICPNCHRLVHRNLIPKECLINLVDYIGDTWKDFYFG